MTRSEFKRPRGRAGRPPLRSTLYLVLALPKLRGVDVSPRSTPQLYATWLELHRKCTGYDLVDKKRSFRIAVRNARRLAERMPRR